MSDKNARKIATDGGQTPHSMGWLPKWDVVIAEPGAKSRIDGVNGELHLVWLQGTARVGNPGREMVSEPA